MPELPVPSFHKLVIFIFVLSDVCEHSIVGLLLILKYLDDLVVLVVQTLKFYLISSIHFDYFCKKFWIWWCCSLLLGSKVVDRDWKRVLDYSFSWGMMGLGLLDINLNIIALKNILNQACLLLELNFDQQTFVFVNIIYI